MVLGVTEINGDGLGMADMQVTVGLGRKSRHHPLPGSLEMSPLVLLVDLGVLAGGMQTGKETLGENRNRIGSCGWIGGDLFDNGVTLGSGGFGGRLYYRASENWSSAPGGGRS